MSKHLSDREIDQILYQLHERLDFKERDRVREMLRRAREGGLYEQELHKELVKMRDSHLISESDHQAIEEAIFGAPSQ